MAVHIQLCKIEKQTHVHTACTVQQNVQTIVYKVEQSNLSIQTSCTILKTCKSVYEKYNMSVQPIRTNCSMCTLCTNCKICRLVYEMEQTVQVSVRNGTTSAS